MHGMSVTCNLDSNQVWAKSVYRYACTIKVPPLVSVPASETNQFFTAQVSPTLSAVPDSHMHTLQFHDFQYQTMFHFTTWITRLSRRDIEI